MTRTALGGEMEWEALSDQSIEAFQEHLPRASTTAVVTVPCHPQTSISNCLHCPCHECVNTGTPLCRSQTLEAEWKQNLFCDGRKISSCGYWIHEASQDLSLSNTCIQTWLVGCFGRMNPWCIILFMCKRDIWLWIEFEFVIPAFSVSETLDFIVGHCNVFVSKFSC
jgi:hypothetical protein